DVAQTTVVTVGATLIDFVVNPNRLQGGTSTTGTVTLSCPAAPSAFVSLSATTATVSVPPTVTISPGQTSATFTIATHPVTAIVDAAVSASLASTSISASLRVTVLPLSSIIALPF